MKKYIAVFLAIVVSLSLCACGSSGSVAPSEPLSLAGNWEEADKSETYQAGFIDDSTIEIYWIMDDGTYALYWSGSYSKPDTAENNYTWESQNDKSRTDSALLASSDDMKQFTYSNGELSYEVSAMGMTRTVVLVQTDTDYSSIYDGNRDSETPSYENLQLNKSGYTVFSTGEYNYVYYAVEIFNPNADIAVEFPTIEKTEKNDSGTILGTETQVLMGIAAGDSLLYGNSFAIEGEPPTTLEIALAIPDDYNFVSQEGSEIIYSADLVVRNVSELGGDNKRYTGEVTNNSKVDLSNVCMCVVYKNGGEAVGGDIAFIENLNSGATKAFEIPTYNGFTGYDSYEIVALQW